MTCNFHKAAAQTNVDQFGNLIYTLITPAHNEELFIEQTIKSMIDQTVLPIRWFVVSDGSTDGTNDIISSYASQYSWIEAVIRPPRIGRHFAGKVEAFNAGYERAQNLKYDVIGSLDADVSFDPEYFEFLLSKLTADPRLGLVGTPFREGNFVYDYRFTNIEHVSGACQLFRRQCFEAIGGYQPIHAGGIDLVAVISARLRGWRTRTFIEKTCEHHKKTQAAKYSGPHAQYRSGHHDHLMGMHPLWQLFRSVYQMRRQPFVIGGICLLFGYFRAWITRVKRPVSHEFVAFRRKEEMRRLRAFLLGRSRKCSDPSPSI